MADLSVNIAGVEFKNPIMEAVLHGFDNEAAGSICEDPVELSTWEVLTELCVGEIHS